MELVEAKRDWVFCDSSMVANKFGLNHKDVVRTIHRIQNDLKKINFKNIPICKTEIRVYRGREYTAYLMSRDFFSLLVPRFKGLKAFEWQLKFNDAFYLMEKQLLSKVNNEQDIKWLGGRKQLKITRREETDIIKEFIEYAEKQGSQHAQYYYKHYTNATYKALGLVAQKYPKLRDTLDMYQMAQITLAEQLVRNKLRKYMGLGRHYTDIYSSIKQDLLNLGETLQLI